MTKVGPLFWNCAGDSCSLLKQEADSEQRQTDAKPRKKAPLRRHVSQYQLASFLWFLFSTSRYHKNKQTKQNKPKTTTTNNKKIMKHWKQTNEERRFCAVNSLSLGPSVLSAGTRAVLGGWSNSTQRKEMHKVPLKYYLFLLTFAA